MHTPTTLDTDHTNALTYNGKMSFYHEMDFFHEMDLYPEPQYITPSPKAITKPAPKRGKTRTPQRSSEKPHHHSTPYPAPSCSNPSPKRGKGRPPQWSEAWRKRLVVLRMCGLELKEILEIIGVISEGEFVPDYP
jgi:hypothetical protein